MIWFFVGLLNFCFSSSLAETVSIEVKGEQVLTDGERTQVRRLPSSKTYNFITSGNCGDSTHSNSRQPTSAECEYYVEDVLNKNGDFDDEDSSSWPFGCYKYTADQFYWNMRSGGKDCDNKLGCVCVDDSPPPCANTGGTLANTGDKCTCGTATCTSSTGMVCRANRCWKKVFVNTKFGRYVTLQISCF